MTSRAFRAAGTAASLFALFFMLGGHWLALQSVAWTRMLAEFSQTGSIREALGKTFDGRHPCEMCVRIQEGRQEEQRDQQQSPSARPEKAPELFCESPPVIVPSAPTAAEDAVAFVPRRLPNFIDSPPCPPPRFLPAAV